MSPLWRSPPFLLSLSPLSRFVFHATRETGRKTYSRIRPLPLQTSVIGTGMKRIFFCQSQETREYRKEPTLSPRLSSGCFLRVPALVPSSVSRMLRFPHGIPAVSVLPLVGVSPSCDVGSTFFFFPASRRGLYQAVFRGSFG